MSAEPNRPNPPVAGFALNEHDALPAGTRFGEFEIIRVLGVGGFGIVYLAQDHSLERQVALKEYMPASLAARGAGPMITIRAGSFAETYAVGLRSFINEARLLARFDHASLVKVYRFWEDNGTAYMVMPYLQGRTLRDARRAMGGPPDEAWIRSVLDPMLDALEQLHREGVFHRDIAPDNILLPPEGAPILLDFGAARRVISDRTQSLTAILKPSYAPIEQYAEMNAMRQGPWTDIYALGAVLHYLLFGVPPSPATARAVQPDAEQIEQRIVPGVSPRFMSAVAWMLGVRPVERPQNVASLRAALNGQVPIPSSVRHDVTVPGDTALMPIARLPAAAPATAPATATATSTATATATDFPPTQLEAPFAPTMRVEGSSYAAETQLDTAHQPTELMTTPVAPAAEAPSAPRVAPPPSAAPAFAPAFAPGAAPMRSTPPGTPPPAYVPPPRPPKVPVEAPVETPMPAAPEQAAPIAKPPSSKRGWMAAGFAAALALAAVVLWQFIGVIGGPRAVAPAVAAAVASAPASVAPVAAAGVYTGPTVAQVASVPQWGAGASVPAPVVAPKPSEIKPEPAAATDRSRPKPVAAASSDVVMDNGAIPPAGEERRARLTPRPANRSADTLTAAGPVTAREACGDRRFFALAVCIERECDRPRFRDDPQCVRLLESKRRREER